MRGAEGAGQLRFEGRGAGLREAPLPVGHLIGRPSSWMAFSCVAFVGVAFCRSAPAVQGRR
eukprot:2714626-Lingulodinium_polyedra.AAC.1